MKPAWMEFAEHEVGVKEVKGSQHNPSIISYWQEAHLIGFSDDETPWCAAFANAMLERAGFEGTRRASAKSFLRWGSAMPGPALGAVTVLNRPGGAPWQGHVGFYVGEDDKNVYLLGGNQGDRVCVAPFAKARVAGYRWPVPGQQVERLPPPVGGEGQTVSDR